MKRLITSILLLGLLVALGLGGVGFFLYMKMFKGGEGSVEEEDDEEGMDFEIEEEEEEDDIVVEETA